MNKQLLVIAIVMAVIGVNEFSAMEERDPLKKDLHYCAAGAEKLEVCFYRNYHNYPGDLLSQTTDKDSDGNVPLHEAAAFGRLQNVKTLLNLMREKGVANPINVLNNKGETPLDKALYFKHSAVASYLKQHGGKRGCDL